MYAVSIGNCGAHAVDIKQLLFLFYNVISLIIMCVFPLIQHYSGARWVCDECEVGRRNIRGEDRGLKPTAAVSKFVQFQCHI